MGSMDLHEFNGYGVYVFCRNPVINKISNHAYIERGTPC